MIDLVVFILCFVLLSLLAAWYDQRVWNRGICRKTGEPWEYATTDSQGGRLYRSGSESTWISWPADGKEVPKDVVSRLANIVSDE